ncbi:hypothetical protein D3C80_1615970 [compost metagenome]
MEKKNQIGLVLCLLALISSSLFVKISIQGASFYLFYFEWEALKGLYTSLKEKPLFGFAYSLLILTHFGIILLPFFIRKRCFKNLLLFLPLTYILLHYITGKGLMLMMLVPFIGIWLICCIFYMVANKHNHV